MVKLRPQVASNFLMGQKVHDSSQKLPNWPKIDKGGKKVLKFGKNSKRYQKLPKFAKISQKWPPKAKAPKTC